MPQRYLSPDREAEFPNLKRSDYQVTSDEDDKYNCIAHAAGKNNMPWWPVGEEDEGVFWPEGVPREETVEAFVAAYKTEGYVLCDGPDAEAGYEKIAIYAKSSGEPTHAARQVIKSGGWTSKLGVLWEDIEHKHLESVNCAEYGSPCKYMKRRV
jgi:hypothetical protein